MCSGKKELYLYINKIFPNVGKKLAIVLAICHIFTGNDFNPLFYGKGKKEHSLFCEIQDAFIELLGDDNDLTTSSDLFKVIEEFVCQRIL